MSGIRRDNLDKLFSQWVRARAGWACEACGKSEPPLDCAHIVSRRHRNTRWDDANAVCLCRGCHMFYEQHPHDWADWTRKHLGTDHVEAVRERAKSTDKVTESDRNGIADALVVKLENWGEQPVCTGKKRAKKKAAKKKGLVASGANKGKRQKVNSGRYKRKVNGETVKREDA